MQGDDQQQQQHIRPLPPNPYHKLTLIGHSDSVRAIAGFGNKIVSGSYDMQVRVWDLSTGQCLHRMTGHNAKVYSIVIDRPNRHCLSGSLDGTVRVWNLDDGSCLWTLRGHAELVGLLDVNSEYMVSAGADSTLRVWSPHTGECQHVLRVSTGAITCFQHDRLKILSGSEGSLKLWDIRTGQFCRNLLTGMRGVWQVKFDQRRCVAAVQNESHTSFEVLDFGYNVAGG